LVDQGGGRPSVATAINGDNDIGKHMHLAALLDKSATGIFNAFAVVFF
jgi:hypothetical protein